MNIFITVDVETYTGDYAADVWGGGLGLGYLLDRITAHGLRATFFMEALAATRWGIEPLRQVCGAILDAGQEIQLHVHPVVARLEGFEDRDDCLWSHPADVQRRLIEEGIRILGQCGVPKITAFRAGDLAANADTLAAMEQAGIRLGSNRDLDRKSTLRTRINDLFPVVNDLSCRGAVHDLPVTAFRSAIPFLDGRFRHAQVTALGASELADGLRRMASAGYACATILTHPKEFFRMDHGTAAPVRRNVRRWEALLGTLKGREGFRMLTAGECLGATPLPERSPPQVRLNPFYSGVRVLEQAAGRL